MPGQYPNENQQLQLLVWEPLLEALAVAVHVPVGCLPPQCSAAAEGRWQPAGPQAGVVRVYDMLKGLYMWTCSVKASRNHHLQEVANKRSNGCLIPKEFRNQDYICRTAGLHHLIVAMFLQKAQHYSCCIVI